MVAASTSSKPTRRRRRDASPARGRRRSRRWPSGHWRRRQRRAAAFGSSSAHRLVTALPGPVARSRRAGRSSTRPARARPEKPSPRRAASRSRSLDHGRRGPCRRSAGMRVAACEPARRRRSRRRLAGGRRVADADHRVPRSARADAAADGSVHGGDHDAVRTAVEDVLEEAAVSRSRRRRRCCRRRCRSRRPHRVGQATGEHAVEGVGDVGNDDSDHLRPPGAQRAGDVVRPVTEGLHDARGRATRVVARQRACPEARGRQSSG